MDIKKLKELKVFDICFPAIQLPQTASRWILCIDGAARNNPGVAGAGVYLFNSDGPVVKTGCFLGTKTNNQAEYLALVLGLYYATKNMKPDDGLWILSDSELLIRQMQGKYRVKNAELKRLYDIAYLLLQKSTYSFCHILRDYNTEADRLANYGIDSQERPPSSFVTFLSNHDIVL